jgi:hypothetical protein
MMRSAVVASGKLYAYGRAFGSESLTGGAILLGIKTADMEIEGRMELSWFMELDGRDVELGRTLFVVESKVDEN